MDSRLRGNDATVALHGARQFLDPCNRMAPYALTLGVYDGKTFSALPSEPLPRVQREVPVATVFLEEVQLEDDRGHQVEIAERMRAARDAMPPLGVGVKELIEAGREG